MEEHAQWQKEEAEIVQNDKENRDLRKGGLFKGCFERRHYTRTRPLHDVEDNVDRCPHCHWELEDGECLRCGIPNEDDFWSDYSGSELDDLVGGEDDMGLDEELDAELDAQDGDFDFGLETGFGADINPWRELDNNTADEDDVERDPLDHRINQLLRREVQARNRRRALEYQRHGREQDRLVGFDVHGGWSHDEEAEDDDSDEDDGSSMQDFIDDDEPINHNEGGTYDDRSESEEPVSSAPRLSQRARARRTIQSDSEEEDGSDTERGSPTHNDSEDDSDDEPPEVTSSRPAPGRNRTRAIVVSDDDSEDSDDDDVSEDDHVGFSPMQSTDDGYDNEMGSEEGHGYGNDCGDSDDDDEDGGNDLRFDVDEYLNRGNGSDEDGSDEDNVWWGPSFPRC